MHVPLDKLIQGNQTAQVLNLGVARDVKEEGGDSYTPLGLCINCKVWIFGVDAYGLFFFLAKEVNSSQVGFYRCFSTRLEQYSTHD